MFNFRKISINRVVGKIVELGTPSLVLIVAMEVCIRRAVARCIGMVKTKSANLWRVVSISIH